MNYNEVIQLLSETIADAIDKRTSSLHYNKTEVAVILSKENDHYKIRIHDKEYKATSYFDFNRNESAMAIIPNNSYSNIFLLPYQK